MELDGGKQNEIKAEKCSNFPEDLSIGNHQGAKFTVTLAAFCLSEGHLNVEL